MKIAGLMTVKNYRDRSGAFESLQALSDITIVLDDNSTTQFKHRHQCDEYIALENKLLWNDTANRTLLMYRAFVHGCQWTVWIDDDIIYSKNFQCRGDVIRYINFLEAINRDTGWFVLRDLWESHNQYRTDGIWSRKSITVLRKNWFYYPKINIPAANLRLHRPVYPGNMKQPTFVTKKYIAYHCGCFTHAARAARVAKYCEQDPQNGFQKDYSYMLRTRGLKLAMVTTPDLDVIRKKLQG